MTFSHSGHSVLTEHTQRARNSMHIKKKAAQQFQIIEGTKSSQIGVK